MKKTAEEILNKHRANNDTAPHWITNKDALQAMKDYAIFVASETKRKCAKQATVKIIGQIAMIDKESIESVIIETP